MVRSNRSQAALARDLEIDGRELRRRLDPYAATKIGALEETARALGHGFALVPMSGTHWHLGAKSKAALATSDVGINRGRRVEHTLAASALSVSSGALKAASGRSKATAGNRLSTARRKVASKKATPGKRV